jgi:hypothetical protein
MAAFFAQASYDWKCGRQDQRVRITVAQVCHARMIYISGSANPFIRMMIILQ